MNPKKRDNSMILRLLIGAAIGQTPEDFADQELFIMDMQRNKAAETQSSTTPVEWQSRVWEQNYQHWNIAPLDDSVS